MSNYSYHRILPQNAKDSYVEFDVVDFQMSFPNRSLVLGSVRLEGELEVVVDGSITLNRGVGSSIGADNVNKLDVKLDGEVGAHATLESVTTRISGNVVESLGDYARYVKMSACAMSSVSDTMNSSNVCELKCPSDEMTNNIIMGEIVETDPTMSSTLPLRNNPDFSIKPRICLNGGSGNVAHNRVGDITVSFNLARNFSALFGIDMASAVSYSLKDLRLVYNTVMDDPSNNAPVPVRTKINIKQSLQSSNANVNVRVPAICDAVSCSFNVQSQENTPKNNNQILHPIPNLRTTQFLFNDSTNSLVSYQIRSMAEVIDRAIDSFVDAPKNALSTTRLANGNGFMIGLNFDDSIDLAQQKFSVELDSSISNIVPLVMYMYFHSVIQI